MTEQPTYDPYEFREKTEKSASNFEVVIHLIKASFGIGILSLPFAINRAGWVISSAVAFPLAVLLIYSMHMLIRTMYKICVLKQQPYISYEDCMNAVALDGPKGWKKSATCLKVSIRTLLIIYPLGTCIAYVIFISKGLNQIYPLVENEEYSLYAYEAIVFIPIFLINCLPNLHKLASVSIFANILTMTTFAGLLYFFYGVGDFPEEGDHKMVGTVLGVALFPGTVFFALEAASVILSLEEHMARPQYFLGYFGMFNIGMVTVIFVYCLIGISGYIKYGENLLPSINLNIPQGSSVALVMKYLFIICIYCSYPLQFYPVMVFIWEDHLLKRVENKQKLYETLFKFGMTLFTVIAALIMPEFDLVVTLVGATCISTLGLIYPGLMEYLYFWNKNSGKVNGTMVKDIIIMIIGIILFITVIVAVIIQKIITTMQIENTKSRLYGL